MVLTSKTNNSLRHYNHKIKYNIIIIIVIKSIRYHHRRLQVLQVWEVSSFALDVVPAAQQQLFSLLAGASFFLIAEQSIPSPFEIYW